MSEVALNILLDSRFVYQQQSNNHNHIESDSDSYNESQSDLSSVDDEESSYFGKMRMLETNNDKILGGESYYDDSEDEDSFMDEILKEDGDLQSVLLRRVQLENNNEEEHFGEKHQQQQKVFMSQDMVEKDIIIDETEYSQLDERQEEHNEPQQQQRPEEEQYYDDGVPKKVLIDQQSSYTNKENNSNTYYNNTNYHNNKEYNTNNNRKVTMNVNNITKSDDEMSKKSSDKKSMNNKPPVPKNNNNNSGNGTNNIIDPALLSVAQKAKMFQCKMNQNNNGSNNNTNSLYMSPYKKQHQNWNTNGRGWNSKNQVIVDDALVNSMSTMEITNNENNTPSNNEYKENAHNNNNHTNSDNKYNGYNNNKVPLSSNVSAGSSKPSTSSSPFKKNSNRNVLKALNLNNTPPRPNNTKQSRYLRTTENQNNRMNNKLNESTISSISVGSSIFSGSNDNANSTNNNTYNNNSQNNNNNNGMLSNGLSPRTAKVVAMDNPATRAALLHKQHQLTTSRKDSLQQQIKPVYFAGRLGKDRFGAYRNHNNQYNQNNQMLLRSWSGGMGYLSPNKSLQQQVQPIAAEKNIFTFESEKSTVHKEISTPEIISTKTETMEAVQAVTPSIMYNHKNTTPSKTFQLITTPDDTRNSKETHHELLPPRSAKSNKSKTTKSPYKSPYKAPYKSPYNESTSSSQYLTTPQQAHMSKQATHLYDSNRVMNLTPPPPSSIAAEESTAHNDASSPITTITIRSKSSHVSRSGSSNYKRDTSNTPNINKVTFSCQSSPSPQHSVQKQERVPTPGRRFNFDNESTPPPRRTDHHHSPYMSHNNTPYTVTSTENEMELGASPFKSDDINLQTITTTTITTTPKGCRITKSRSIQNSSNNKRNDSLHIETTSTSPSREQEETNISPFSYLVQDNNYHHTDVVTTHTSTPMALLSEEQLIIASNSNTKLLLIDESGIDSIMDDMASELDDFDMLMMNNQNLCNLNTTTISTTPRRPPPLDDIFALSPSPDHVVELESIINDIMVISNGSTTNQRQDKEYWQGISLSYSDDYNQDRKHSRNVMQQQREGHINENVEVVDHIGFSDEPQIPTPTTASRTTSSNKSYKTKVLEDGTNSITSLPPSRCTDYMNPLKVLKLTATSKKHKKKRSKNKSRRKSHDDSNNYDTTIHHHNNKNNNMCHEAQENEINTSKIRKKKTKQGITFLPQLHQGKAFV